MSQSRRYISGLRRARAREGAARRTRAARALLDGLDIDPAAAQCAREVSVALREIRGTKPDEVWQAVWDAHIALATANRRNLSAPPSPRPRTTRCSGSPTASASSPRFAMHVRNALEDFHVEHLDDDHMAAQPDRPQQDPGGTGHAAPQAPTRTRRCKPTPSWAKRSTRT
jgi:hypothetical protein